MMGSKFGFLAVVTVILVLATGLLAGTSRTEAVGRTADCSRLISQMRRLLASGRTVDPALLLAVRDCLVADKALSAAAPPNEPISTQQAVGPAAVLASFQVTGFICLHFNTDGTVSSPDPTFHVTSGSYFGSPLFFSFFSYSGSFYLGGFSAFGLTIGPFLVQLISLGAVQTGTQTAC